VGCLSVCFLPKGREKGQEGTELYRKKKKPLLEEGTEVKFKELNDHKERRRVGLKKEKYRGRSRGAMTEIPRV